MVNPRNCVICGRPVAVATGDEWTCSPTCTDALARTARMEAEIRAAMRLAEPDPISDDDPATEAEVARAAVGAPTKRFVGAVDLADDLDAAISLLESIRRLERVRAPVILSVVDLVRGVLDGVSVALGAARDGGVVPEDDHLSEGSLRSGD